MKYKTQYLIFISLSILYISFGYGVTVSNDSVTNVDQIVSLEIWSRSSHFAFHLFGVIFYLIFSKLLGLSAVTSIEIMLAVFSAAASAALYRLNFKIFNNEKQAIITVVLYSLASGIFRFSSQIEYLILVPSFGIISLYFYSKGQNIVGGIFLGFGLLTSFLVVLFTPMFFLFDAHKKLFRKQNIIFALSTIIIWFAVNIFTFKETISGHWSYGAEVFYYKEALGEMNFLRTAAIYIYGYLRSFNIIIVIMPLVLYYLYISNKKLFYVLIIIILIHLPIAIPEARYGGYQMTAYPIIAISAGYFLFDSLNKNRYLVGLLIVLYAVMNLFVVTTERTFFRDLKQTYVQLNNNLEKNSVLIVYQALKPIKNVYAPNLQVFDLLSDYQNKMSVIGSAYVPTDLNDIISNNNTIYVLESGVSMPDDHLKLVFSQFTKNQGAKVKGFALEKILDMKLSFQIEKLENYPLDVYKINKR